MAETQSIVLNKRNWGMSNDEYAWGSFFYWENVDIRSNSKSFKLSNRVVSSVMNFRSNWRSCKLIPSIWQADIFWFTADWYLESSQKHNDFSSGTQNNWWYLYKIASWWYTNAVIAWTYLFWTTTTSKLDVFNISTADAYWYGLFWSELVTTPDLTSATWRSVWAWRATWVAWAVHTAWNTATLTQTITPWVWTWKISIYINSRTAWTLAVTYQWASLWTISIVSGVIQNKRYTFNTTTSESDLITLTPSTDFNWTVQYVDARLYDSTKFKKDITLATRGTNSWYFYNRPMLAVGDFVYIWSWQTLEYIDMSIAFASRDALDALTLQPWDNIVWLTQIWDVINIYCNNWPDWIKYIWNRVDENPAEKIIRKNKQFASVDWDWNQDYVIVWNDYHRLLYITNGYSKQLVTNSWFMLHPDYGFDAYTLENKFDYKKVLWFANESVYMWWTYWLYTYWLKFPWFPLSIVKEWAKNTYVPAVAYTAMCYTNNPVLAHRTTWLTVNYNSIADVREYNFMKQWYIVTNPLIFDNLWTEKLIRKLRIGYLLPSSTCSINVYAKVNDKHYITFDVAWITVAPTVWAIYTNYSSNVFTVVKTNLTLSWTYSWTITCVAEYPSDPDWLYYWGSLTKTSWTWDASITYTDRDNFVLVKTITTDKYKYANEYILWEDFIDIKMPEVVYKLQLKIELLSTSYDYTPEIFDIPVLSDIVENEF